MRKALRSGRETKSYKQEPGEGDGHTNLQNHLRVCLGEDHKRQYINYLNKAGIDWKSIATQNARDFDVSGT